MRYVDRKFGRVVRRWTALAALAVPLLAYLATMAPTITWAHDGADGGDLITAAYTLGVPHPPGYPTYCLLGWLFAHLPLGDVAWRLNLMSVTGAVLTVSGLYAAVLEWGLEGPRTDQGVLWAGLGAAWGLAFVPLFWSQAIITEVYSVNAAFVAWTLFLAFRVWRTGRSRLALGVVWGLSLSMHPTGLAMLPIVAWALVCKRQGRSSLSVLVPWLAGIALGLSLFLYLPLRANRGAVTWGDPSTLAGWWWVVSGALYRGYAFALPGRAVPTRLVALAQYLASGYGPTGAALSMVGVGTLARQQRGLLLTSGLTWLLYVAYAIGYDTTDSYVYLIPALIVFALWLGLGLVESLRWLRGRLGAGGLRVGVCLACAGPLIALALHFHTMDVHWDTEAYHFGEAVLAAAPQRAVLLTTQDAHTFTLWYFQHVIEQRPDVVVVDRGLLMYDWYRIGLARASLDLAVLGDDAGGLSRANRARPICEVIGKEGRWLTCEESK